MDLKESLTNRVKEIPLSKPVNFPLCLAPMVGLSHVALRHVIQEYMPAGAETLWYTEMLNSRRIPHEDLGKTNETLRTDLEISGHGCLIPQILGNEEEPIRDSTAALKTWGAGGIDINMGCPVQKALRHNYGVALMGDPDYAAQVVKMATMHTDLPVSVKLRAVGSTHEFSELLKFVSGLRREGAAWVTLHPRTAAQKRRGSADWEQIKLLTEAVDFPIVGNGDVQTAADALAMLTETGASMAMSGRGFAARPWMAWQLGEALGFPAPPGREGLRAPQTSVEEGKEYGRSLVRFIDLSVQYFGEEQALRKIRFYVRTTSVWLQFGQRVLSIVTKLQTTSEMKIALMAFFEFPQEMSEKTELRQ